jgi:hypothetical protein
MKIIDINNQERNCDKVYLDPHWPGFVTVLFVSKNRPGYKHTEWMPQVQFFQNNPSLIGQVSADFLPTPLPPQIAGVVTSAGIGALSDSTKDWKTNLYAGFFCWISRGKGEGQVRVILSNNKTKLTLDKPWETKPNKTSQYSILHNRPQTSVNNKNTLPEVDMQSLEEKARKFDIERGVKPAPRQYTKEK